MEIKRVLVVGSGLMGSGIAQVCAQAGVQVLLHDVSEKALARALKNIDWSVGKFVEKGQLKESREAILQRITTAERLPEKADVGLAIEAAFEDLAIKQSIFKQLDEACGPETLIASNTSAIPITELAAVTQRPDKVLGLHFFSPVPMMQAVEVIKGIRTSEQTAAAGKAFVNRIGKEPIMVRRDVAVKFSPADGDGRLLKFCVYAVLKSLITTAACVPPATATDTIHNHFDSALMTDSPLPIFRGRHRAPALKTPPFNVLTRVS